MNSELEFELGKREKGRGRTGGTAEGGGKKIIHGVDR